MENDPYCRNDRRVAPITYASAPVESKTLHLGGLTSKPGEKYGLGCAGYNGSLLAMSSGMASLFTRIAVVLSRTYACDM